MEQCDDGSDEDVDLCLGPGGYPDCTESEFQCNNRECIRKELLCDVSFDCPDGEDEDDCGEGSGGSARVCLIALVAHSDVADDHACEADEFDCGNGYCISESLKCNQVPDCLNATDENKSFCEPRYPNDQYCPDYTFECAHTGVSVH